MNTHVLPALVLILSACGHMQAYEQEIRAAEEAAAARPKPAPRLSHAERTLHIRAYADRDYREGHPNYRADVEELVEVAGLLVGPQLDAALVLDGVREWERECDTAVPEACLAELARLDAGAKDVWVVALTSELPSLSRDLDALGHASALGNHVLMHGLGERDELDDFDMTARELREAELKALRVERRRHKGALTLLHALGHSLGGLHGGDASTVMSREYVPEQAAFTPESTELFTFMIDARLRGDEADSVRSAYRLWLDEHPRAFEREEYEARLADLSGAEAPGRTLSDEDRALLEAAHARARDGQTAAALSSARELARRYPDVAEVQSFACDLSKQNASGTADPACSRAEQLVAP